MTKGSAIILGSLRPVFSPGCVFSAEHMTMYVAWLQQTCKLNVDASSAPFPNAREFNAFIRAQGSRYPQARSHCQHKRHPNDRFSKEYCPVCLFHIHINYIKFIDVAWDRKGGPWKNNMDDEYRMIGRARNFARMELANHMHKVDGLAEQERWWNTQNPKADLNGVYSFCQVQGMYRSWLNLASTASDVKRSPPKKVTWSNDTKDYTRRSAEEMDWEYNA